MTSSSNRQLVAAAGGSATGICEGCKYRRSLWYCDADDAFLCQVCDVSVHSANPLAGRHHRIQINAIAGAPAGNATDPAWHQFKRKPRTPRLHRHSKGQSIIPLQPLVLELEVPTGHHQHSKGQSIIPVQPLVPEYEMPMDDNTEEEESLLQYRVPIFDPMLFPNLDYHKSVTPLPNISQPVTITNDNTEFNIMDFSASIDSLLGEEGRSFCMEELGLVESREREVGYYCIGESLEVKPEIGEDNTMPQIYGECKVIKPELGRITEEDNSMETLEFDLADCGSREAKDNNVVVEQLETRMSLRIDYEAIIAEWSNTHLSSPWMDGQRPQLNQDDYFSPDYMEQNMWNGGVPVQIEGGVDERGREERLLRYREKRRRRLFSKKIRYEVRKLNAENRPRMKGRFVKKSNFTPRPTS